MPLNASQLQDIQQAQSMVNGHLATINKLLKLENDPIESVVDFEALSEYPVEDSYRNYLATRIYDNYFSTVSRFLYYLLDYTDDTRRYAPIYIEEFQNRWWARELTFEFVEAESSWKMNSGNAIFRDGALVIQVPPAKFNYNAYDSVYKNMEVILDEDIGEGMVAKYKVSIEEAKAEFSKLESRLRALTKENYQFDFDFERFWINGHVERINKEYRLREPLLSVQYANRLTGLIEQYVSSFPVGLSFLNEMTPSRKIRFMLGPVQNTDAQYDLYLENGAIVLKVPEEKFCYNVYGIGERYAGIQQLVDAYMASKPKVERVPSPAELERLAKRKQREEEAMRRKQEREKAIAELKLKYENDN